MTDVKEIRDGRSDDTRKKQPDEYQSPRRILARTLGVDPTDSGGRKRVQSNPRKFIGTTMASLKKNFSHVSPGVWEYPSVD